LSIHVTVKPRIDKNSYSESVQIKRGQSFTIEIKYTGEPVPTAKWSLKTGAKVQHPYMKELRYIYWRLLHCHMNYESTCINSSAIWFIGIIHVML